jgi:small subunit ribosomal protein S19e
MIGGKTGHKGFQVREVPAAAFVDALAKHFETAQIIKAPEWADLVKTGFLQQMPPTRSNWWYVRAASIARQIYMNNSTSVSGLVFRYGANFNAGVTPKHHEEASRKVVRVILQQLEKAGLVSIKENKGRVLTPKGFKLLDQVANEAAKQ